MTRFSSKLLIFVIALALLVLVIAFTRFQIQRQAERPMPIPQKENTAADVSVITVTPNQYQAEISGFGATQTHFSITLAAQVAGQVDALSAQFENGKRLKQGDWLAKLENSDYQAAVNSAKQVLAQAQVSLLEEQRQGIQALAEWKSSGLTGQPDSELVLREPQLAAAKASVEQAKASLISAEKDLRQSTISAPFDALVVERNIAPGSFVQSGTTVATLYSTDRIEVAVPLSAQDWNNLPNIEQLTTERWPVTLTSVEDGSQWPGYVLRSEQHLSAETRQRALIVAIDSPFDAERPLYPGTFIQARLAGLSIPAVWKLPQTAMSQRGEVWYVKADNTIDKFAANNHFSKAGFIYVDVPAALKNHAQQVLVRPLNSYLQGMRVNPVEETADE